MSFRVRLRRTRDLYRDAYCCNQALVSCRGSNMLPKPIKDEYRRSTSMTMETNLRVPMRDGTVLSADLYRPAGAGRYPVLLKRTPYGKQKPRYHSLYMDPVRAASRGYAVVSQDTRGRHASEGATPSATRSRTATIRWSGARSSPGAMATSACSATLITGPPSVSALVDGPSD